MMKIPAVIKFTQFFTNNNLGILYFCAMRTYTNTHTFYVCIYWVRTHVRACVCVAVFTDIDVNMYINFLNARESADTTGYNLKVKIVFIITNNFYCLNILIISLTTHIICSKHIHDNQQHQDNVTTFYMSFYIRNAHQKSYINGKRCTNT